MRQKLFALFAFFSIFLCAHAFSQSSRTVCAKIHAEQISLNTIRLTWNIERTQGVRSLLIFRDERPIESRSLKNLEPIAEISPSATAYTDTVQFYGFYCYCVAARFSDGEIERIILPAINASASGVRIAREEKIERENEEPRLYPEGTLREQPLPRIAMFEREPERRKSIGEDARTSAKELSAPPPARKKLAPYIFEEDLIESKSGDDYVLFQILKTSFIRKRYQESAEKLRDFLRVNRGENATNRATFYLAESYHFLGNQKQAISCFVKTADAYPALSRKWIDESLDEYSIPEE